MARKRKDLGPVLEAHIVALMTRGGTAESIAKATGISRATVGRRMAELKGKVSANRQTQNPAPQPVVTVPASPDESEPDDVLDALLDTARKSMVAAQVDGNVGHVAQMGRLIVTTMGEQRKAAPIEKPDPNDNPDMKALGAQVAARLHILAEQVTE